jgi:flagellar capping protein FliD
MENNKMNAEWKTIESVCKPYGGFVKVITECGGTLVSQLWIKSIQEQTTSLQKQIEERDEEIKMLKADRDCAVQCYNDAESQLSQKDEMLERMAEALEGWDEFDEVLIEYQNSKK